MTKLDTPSVPETEHEEALGSHFNEVSSASKETKEIVTPFAFSINEQVVGLPLASPLRRGIAILVDALLVTLTAKLSIALVSLIASAAIFTASSSKYLPISRNWIRYLIRVFASIGFVVTLIIGLAELADFSESDFIDRETLTPAQLEVVEAYRDKTSADCDTDCLRGALIESQLAAPELFEGEFDTMDSEAIEAYHDFYVSIILLGLLSDESAPTEILVASDADTVQLDSLSETSQDDTSESGAIVGIIAWAKAILADLGLGFGWAAVYFTVFPVLWRGQTPGKKLCNIRVLALNGNYLNLWDAFGRYGGYGAGFATGLLGFIQIYWDPNRQAIHDKISGTVVIKGSPAEFTDH
jgi:hypothetical protein